MKAQETPMEKRLFGTIRHEPRESSGWREPETAVPSPALMSAINHARGKLGGPGAPLRNRYRCVQACGRWLDGFSFFLQSEFITARKFLGTKASIACDVFQFFLVAKSMRAA